ncbi:MAG: 2-oxo acid dehydrogenase subunit E2 [Myxococcota bacterium]|nr:2-oxo acid dehydrogenase subunit E2 [Myxococcota bacterium]
MASETLIRVPDIGDFEDVEVVEIMVAPGDEVAVEDPLISIESDKATMEIPSPVAGRVLEIRVSLGESVSEGNALVVMESDAVEKTADGNEESPGPTPNLAEAEPVDVEAEPVDVKAEPVEVKPAPVASASGASSPGRPEAPMPAAGRGVHASPGVRRYARQLGVTLGETGASGPLGRVLESDVTDHVHRTMSSGEAGVGRGVPPVPPVDFSRFGPVREEPLAKIRRVSAQNLSRSWLNAPHVTQHDEADITTLEDFRRSCKEEANRRGLKLSPLHFVLKAVARVLAEFPDFRSSLAPGGESLVVKDYFHLGVAVDTENGLVVPVIRDVDRKSVFELAAELAELAERARARRLGPGDMQGACFSISSLGGIGGTAFTPIVNVPEVAILGLSKLQVLPRWSGGTDSGAEADFRARAVLPLSLSYDHRVIDGAAAARFTSRLGRMLARPGYLLL